jgi:hypothetical protein
VVCFTYGNRTVVTAYIYFFKSCELENLLLTGSRLVGTLKEERAWNPTIISQWKTKTRLFYYLWFYQRPNTGITCTRKKHDCHPSQHNEKCMGEERNHKPEITMHGKAINP